ncbi:uncharacterized protein Bfra_009627 [Botrytis fragariae]|uniref:Uncharacterized protein n=1 Tax=Botrytis fragariae TaxID=1964551 RepID=A0A8H6AMS5_9HELO|nr:uncharacterized protein Bfra_009627 [Botrytis fragariae]KAF5870244.1 hypothetical protein Bfra_009627 [Botrytis fragariae]
MTAQESASGLDRDFLESSSRKAFSAKAHTANKAASLRKSVSAPTSPQKVSSERIKRTPYDFPLSRSSSNSWLENFWASETGALVQEFWIKSKQWYRSYGNQFGYLYIAYFVLFILITTSNKAISQSHFDLLSNTIGVAGVFSETIENGYLFESIPVELRDASADLRAYHDLYADSSRNSRHHTRAVSNLLSELDGIDYHWKSFENSRDKAITSVKEELQASRAIFQAEYNRLGGANRGWLSGLGKQWAKRILLRDPWESKVHFKESNWINSTIEMENYIDVWRNRRIPELRYKFTSYRGGKTGGLPGLVKEVKDSWLVKASGPKRFRVAPVYELEEVAKKAISLLGQADGIYKVFGHVIQTLKQGGTKRKCAFGRGRLEILLGKFDESIKQLEAAEWAIRERLGRAGSLQDGLLAGWM